MNHLSPIILFVYNRPIHTKQVTEALRKNRNAGKSRLYIFSDGPRNNTVDISKVAEVRELLKSIDGFDSIRIVHRRRHLGLANSVIAGTGEVIYKHESVIVLEDDLVPSVNFLEFMNSALRFYKSKRQIFSISGFSFPLRLPHNYNHQVYLHYRCSSWGWATWNDRWTKVDWGVADFDEFRRCEDCVAKFNRGGEDLATLLNYQLRGKIDSWAIRWCYAHYKNDAFCVYPTVSKINNIGFDNSGTHKVKRTIDSRLDKGDLKSTFPTKIEVNREIVRQLNKQVAFPPNVRLINWIKHHLFLVI